MEWQLQLDRIDNLDELAGYCIQCRRCKLRSTTERIVFAEGDQAAGLMLVGEAPGAEEERQGRPFVGSAGNLLNKILSASGFQRKEVYITNVVKCRPPGNRTPTKGEADCCFVYLVRQIELIQPRLIVCLGLLATRYLVQSEATVSAVRGNVYKKGGIQIVPTYHPAALLRDASRKKPVWRDFQKIRDLYLNSGQR